MIKQLHALFCGTVQGVGFRYTACAIARRHPVTGFVRNLSDGNVELVSEGEESVLQSFLKDIRESSLSEYIRNVEVEWKPAENRFRNFSIAFEGRD